MTTISDVWEAHRDELCEKLFELGEVRMEKLVIKLEERQLIDMIVEMSAQETVEMVVQSVGNRIASNPTLLSNFLNILKTFQGIQPLAETIEDEVNSLGSLMIPGMRPKGKGTSAPCHATGSPSDHSNTASCSNTQSEDSEYGKIHTVPSIQVPQRMPSFTLDTGNVLCQQAPTLSNTSQPLNHLNQGSPNPQGIPNDSGIIVDHSKSSEVEATNLDPTKASPPVQRSQSGTSDSSDSSLLDGVPSRVRKKFQKMKVKNWELRKEIWELKGRLQHEKQTMFDAETCVSNQPVAEHLPPQYTGTMEVDTEPWDETNSSIASYSDVEQEFTTTITGSTFVSQEDIPVEIPDNIPLEIREYIHKLEQEREFLIHKTTETEVERNTLQVQLRSTQTLIENINLFYDRIIHELTLEYQKSFQRCQELQRQIDIATDPGMQSLHLKIELEQENAMLIETIKEMKAELDQLKNDERKLQDLEQQREEIVSVAVRKYVLPSALSAGPHEFEDVFAYYLARNNCQLQGTKCKICSQHLGANQPYCQRCLPAKINQKDHHKHEIDHKFEMLKTADSHIYSEAVLLVACGGNNKDILRGYLSIPKFITPQACHWDLPECTKCDGSTSNLENDFKERYETKHYHCSQPVLVDSDAVLFYIYIHRGLAVNVDLIHYLLCSSCNRHVPGIWNVLQLAWKFRRTILQNHHKDVMEKKQDMQDMVREAKANLLFHTIQQFPDAERYLIEFPFLCDVKLPKVGSCTLVYAQIPPCCWAVPLDPSTPTLSKLRTNFPAVVGQINKMLSEKHKYLKSIEMAGTFPKLIIRYLLKCCFKVSLDTEVVADHD